LQTGQGARRSHVAIDENFDPGPFTVKQVYHGGAFLVLLYDFPNGEPMFESAFTEVDGSLRALITNLLRVHKGLRMCISLHTTLERVIDM
jgi:hypothetical protein